MAVLGMMWCPVLPLPHRLLTNIIMEMCTWTASSLRDEEEGAFTLTRNYDRRGDILKVMVYFQLYSLSLEEGVQEP